MDRKAMVEAVTKRFVDEGRLIEAGWASFELMVLPADASEVQKVEMRMAFFSGAQHLFGSILTMLEPGPDETPTDLRRMDLIDRELAGFIRDFKRRFGA